MRCRLDITRVLKGAPIGSKDYIGTACFALALVWAITGIVFWPETNVDGLYWRFQLVGPRWCVAAGSAAGLALWGVGLLVGARPGAVRRGPLRRLSSRRHVALSVGLRMAGAAVGWLGWAFIFWMFALHQFWGVGTISCFLLSIRDMWALFHLAWYARWTEDSNREVRLREGQESYERVRERHDLKGTSGLPSGLRPHPPRQQAGARNG